MCIRDSPEGREAVLGDYLAFREAYKADRSVLRFHYHDVDGIFVSLAVQPVSYTHLDVYKRQAPSRWRTSTSRTCPCTS